MKKLYQKPEIQVVRINHSVQLMGASAGPGGKYVVTTRVNSGKIFDEEITGSSGGGRSRGWDDWDDEDW